MSKLEPDYEIREDAMNPGQATVQRGEADEILKRLADLKEKQVQIEAEKHDLDNQLKDSRQMIDEMKRDVEVLNNLDPSQYEHIAQEMRADSSADRSPGTPNAPVGGEGNNP